MKADQRLLTLEEASQQPAGRVGGKARVLGTLLKAGFPVPEGYVIPAGCTLPDALPQLGAVLAAKPGSLWAVRSSAASEDSEQASYAGQYSSYLNVTAADVPGAVMRCREAGQDVRLDAYRALSGAETGEDAGLAVIVQVMAPSQVAGIAFTADPRTGDSSELWIEMVPGSGHTAADGTASSLLVRLKREDPGGDMDGSPALLPARVLRDLGKLCLDVERRLGEAQDIEWAYGEGQLRLLQARPLTTNRENWTRANVGEIFPEPVTPLTWSVLQGFLANRRESATPLVRLIDGKVHLRRDLVLRSFEWLLMIDSATVEQALGVEPGGKMGWRRFLRPDFWAASLFFSGDYFGITRRLERKVTRFLSAPRPASREPQSPADCAALIDAWQNWTQTAFRLHLYTTAYAIAASRFRRQKDSAGSLNTRSARIGYGLRDLARRARRDGLGELMLAGKTLAQFEADPRAGGWLAEFASFLAEFGDRCANEFELISPRWKEAPEIPFGILKGFLNGQMRLDELERAEGGAGGYPRAGHMSGFERMSGYREEMKHAVAQGYSGLRQAFLQSGAYLCRAGKLRNAQEIFFLTDGEARRLADAPFDFHERIAMRRKRWEGWQRRDTFRPARTAGAGREQMRGIPVSRGVVSGTARVILELTANLEVQPGEILVLPNADPAWTPLFLQAVGVVCDAGGLLSHSATVAREFGIPAIFNTGAATDRIRDGQPVTLNADEGWVEF